MTSDFDDGVQTYTKCWLCDNMDWCTIPTDSGDWEGGEICRSCYDQS
jgi:hypothetical protein